MTERSLYLNPSDFSRLLESMRDTVERASGVPAYIDDPSTLMGFPVVTSSALAPGQALLLRRPEITIPIQPPRFDPSPFRLFARSHFGMDMIGPSSLACIRSCEGADPIKLPTKAQRRRSAKRFVRDEVARRRREKSTP